MLWLRSPVRTTHILNMHPEAMSNLRTAMSRSSTFRFPFASSDPAGLPS